MPGPMPETWIDSTVSPGRRLSIDPAPDRPGEIRIQIVDRSKALAVYVPAAALADAVRIARLTVHSITANRLGWRIAVAVGDVPEGAVSVFGDPDEQLDRLIAERDALALLLEEHESLQAILQEAPPTETVHASPPLGSDVMPCCGRSPLEALPDRVTVFPRLVTCIDSTVVGA